MPKITKRTVDALPVSPKRQLLRDSEMKGFGLIAMPSGVKTFFAEYRNASGRQRRLKLGRFGVLTPDQARKAAQPALAAVAGGHDPADDRDARRAALTMAELLDRYEKEHVAIHNNPRTAGRMGPLIKKHVRPRLGALKAAAVTRQDILRLHAAMASTPRMANIIVAVLSKVFNLAELWGVRPENTNPCRRVPRYPERPRERFLSEAELGRLGAALTQAASTGLPWHLRAGAKAKHRAKPENQRTRVTPQAIDAIKLLLLTGARLSEVLELEWDHVDLARGTLAMPERKGGRRRPHPVSSMVLEIIAAQPRKAGVPWVLPAPKNEMAHLPVSVLENVWQRIRTHASIEDVRLHDLRHTVGTFASQTGLNAFGIRDLLRHATIAMTGRYVNRDENPVRAVSELLGARIVTGLSGGAQEAGAWPQSAAPASPGAKPT